MVENVNTTSMCCPRLIKREKPMENVKNSLVPPWVTFQSWKTTKMEVWENVQEEGAAGGFHTDLISWSLHPCHWYLQNCHSATHNYKNATLGPQMLAHSLSWRGNDVEMMWQWCGDSLQLNI